MIDPLKSPRPQTRLPEQHIPSLPELLLLIQQHPLITLLELCLKLWTLPWRAQAGADSLVQTLRRFPGSRPLSAPRWLHRQLRRLADEGVIAIGPCCGGLRCTRRWPCLVCLPSLSLEALPDRHSDTRSVTVNFPGRRPVSLVLSGSVGHLVRHDPGGLRRLGGAHVQPSAYGIELHTAANLPLPVLVALESELDDLFEQAEVAHA